MSYFLCDKCSEKHHIFGKDGAKNTAKKMELNFLGEVPLHPKIRELSDAGKPITVSDPNGPQSLPYVEIARSVISRLEDPDFNKDQEGPKITFE